MALNPLFRSQKRPLHLCITPYNTVTQVIEKHVLPEALATTKLFSLLLNLPIELLSEISLMLGGRDITRLWNCGNKRLQHRLGEQGAVKHYDCAPIRASAQLPSILAHLRIQAVAIRFEGPLSPKIELSPHLQQLMISWRQSGHKLCDAFNHTLSSFQSLSALKLSASATPFQQGDAALLKTPPALTNLMIHFKSFDGSVSDILRPGLEKVTIQLDYIRILDFHFPSSLVAAVLTIESFEQVDESGDFPQALSWLSVSSRNYKTSTQLITKLPRSMTVLHISSDDSLESILKAVPLSLMSLDIFNCREVMTVDLMKLMPRTLLRSFLIKNMQNDLSLELVEQLPPALIELDLVPNELRFLQKLPTGLQLLKLMPHAFTLPTGDTECVFLPKELKALTGLRSELIEFCALPESLEELSMIESTFQAQHARRLPSGLKSLRIRSLSLDFAPALPSRLKILQVWVHDAAWTLMTDHVMHLPRTLTNLSLATIQLESAETLSHVPQGLQNLALNMKSVESEGLSPLGRSQLRILCLIVQQDRAGLGDEILTRLPASLVSLTYVTSSVFKDITVDALKHLPRGLLTLTLPESPNIMTLAEKPAFLPPNLRSFDCQGAVPLFMRGPPPPTSSADKPLASCVLL